VGLTLVTDSVTIASRAPRILFSVGREATAFATTTAAITTATPVAWAWGPAAGTSIHRTSLS
jgi:hypothetical protein